MNSETVCQNGYIVFFKGGSQAELCVARQSGGLERFFRCIDKSFYGANNWGEILMF